ncbi:MAG: isocitrate lyase/phosphoenolpyruvate mutase family protein [Thaumarchaeota archaeon]|nr:isocitrate lyase/phosphoenolpyruvate mutase family protein [Nitrososphaerota archaeon]
MNRLREKAERFRGLHHGGILILPNAWDIPSARLFEDEGFPAVATSSAAMMVSLGYPDGEVIPRAEYFGAVGKISEKLSVPLTVDAAAGFGRTPEEVAQTARGVVGAGAVGLNIEDFDPETKKLFRADDQAEKIRQIRKTGEELGVPLVINARTDALRFASGNDRAKFDEAVSRATLYGDAGADCVYPMGLVEPDSIDAFVKAVRFPTNVMVRKGLPPIKELQQMGVARVSFGPYASYAAIGLLKRISREVRSKGTYTAMVDDAITFDELNALAVRKRPE